jgi:hypothetical protein
MRKDNRTRKVFIMSEDKVCCENRYYGLCPDHGMNPEVHASLVKTSIAYHALRPLMIDVAQEVANLLAWEKTDREGAKERGKTAEGRTVTALYYAQKALQKKVEELDEDWSNQ